MWSRKGRNCSVPHGGERFSHYRSLTINRRRRSRRRSRFVRELRQALQDAGYRFVKSLLLRDRRWSFPPVLNAMARYPSTFSSSCHRPRSFGRASVRRSSIGSMNFALTFLGHPGQLCDAQRLAYGRTPAVKPLGIHLKPSISMRSARLVTNRE